MRHHIVIQGKEFLPARKEKILTEKEQVIVLEMINMLNPGDEDEKDYERPAQEWYELLGIQEPNKELQLKGVFQDLMTKVVEIPLDDGWLMTHWLSSLVYSKNPETVEIQLTPELKPYFLQFKNSLTLKKSKK